MPDSATQASEPSGRTQSCVLPSCRRAADTMRVPSGETLGGPGWLPPKENVAPSGGSRADRARSPAACGARARSASAPAAAANAAAIAQESQRDFLLPRSRLAEALRPTVELGTAVFSSKGNWPEELDAAASSSSSSSRASAMSWRRCFASRRRHLLRRSLIFPGVCSRQRRPVRVFLENRRERVGDGLPFEGSSSRSASRRARTRTPRRPSACRRACRAPAPGSCTPPCRGSRPPPSPAP